MPNLLNFFLEPLSYPFMVRGMAAAVIVGIVCALVGSYVILRGMAFFGDALAHAIREAEIYRLTYSRLDEAVALLDEACR